VAKFKETDIMTSIENKQLMQKIFSELSKGNGKPFLESMVSVVTHFDVPIFTFSEGHFGRGVDRGTPRALRASGVCS
jgi:hypothetical protein